MALELIGLFSQGKFPEGIAYTPDSAAYKSAWQETIDTAERYNDPGNFTAFIGFEWTSLIKGNNMHRVVIYRDGAEKASQMVAYTTTPPLGSTNPRDLWKWLTAYEEKTGGEVLAIAHNGNLSNGIMFPLEAQWDGTVLDETYVTQRRKWEPLYETTQIKGDGETHPFLSPERRVRRLRDLGHREPRRLRGEDRRHAGGGVRPRGPEARSRNRDAAGHEPLQVRPDRLHRQPHLPGHGPGGQLLRQALGGGAQPRRA